MSATLWRSIKDTVRHRRNHAIRRSLLIDKSAAKQSQTVDPPHSPDLSDLPPFPDGFLWGAATSSYQVEGNIENNDWHIFTTSKAIRQRVHRLAGFVGATIDLRPAGEAVGHHDLGVLKEDLDRAKLLGLNAYRFSIEWSRIEPSRGMFDEEALRYYSDAIDAMLERGLKPIVTLNHLTLPAWVLTPPQKSSVLRVIGYPQAIPDNDFNTSLRGWENTATVEAFRDFVCVVVAAYMDRVDTWITLNEPTGSIIGVGYLGAIWPPGFALDGGRARTAYLNLLRAHVHAYLAIKRLYQNRPSHVGIAHVITYPKRGGMGPETAAWKGAALAASVGAAIGYVLGNIGGALAGLLAGGVVGAVGAALATEKLNEGAWRQFTYFYNYHFLDAVIDGSVDLAIDCRKGKQNLVDARAFFGLPDDQPWRPRIDFIGLNYFRSAYVYFHPAIALKASFAGGVFDFDLHRSSQEHSLLNQLGWEICPEGLYFMLKDLHVRYRNAEGASLPIYITENGIAEEEDTNRAPFIVAHLQQLLLAIREGVDVRGYIHWSLMDNFEWAEGYQARARFGLFTVDREARDSERNPASPRHITRGALALQYVIAETAPVSVPQEDRPGTPVLRIKGLGQAAARFGSISPDGQTVEPPSQSMGAMWEGTIDGATPVIPFRLYLSQLSRLEVDGAKLDRWVGMIFFHRLNCWIRLGEISWRSEREGIDTLGFSHPDETKAEGPTRVYRATMNGATSHLEGTLTSGRVQAHWYARRMPCRGVGKSWD